MSKQFNFFLSHPPLPVGFVLFTFSGNDNIPRFQYLTSFPNLRHGWADHRDGQVQELLEEIQSTFCENYIMHELKTKGLTLIYYV